MELNNDKIKNEKKGDFFQLTKHQVQESVDHYEKVIGKSPSIFNLKPVDESKLLEKAIPFQKRLNSLDSAMLEDSAYLALDNADLKLEKRIESFEQIISEVDEKLTVAQTLKDEKAQIELESQKKLLRRNLENLKEQYKTQNLDTKLTNIVTKILEFPAKIKREIKVQLKIMFRKSKFLRKYTPIVRSMTIRETLGRLDKINKSVDQLVQMKVPFGEQEERYKTLVNHLAKATTLHSQIRKEILG